MKFEYYQDKEGNAYELKTDLEQLLVHDIFEQDKEIERLNNIIKEFEEELKWQRKVSLSLNEAFAVSRIDTLINKLKELKGVDK